MSEQDIVKAMSLIMAKKDKLFLDARCTVVEVEYNLDKDEFSIVLQMWNSREELYTFLDVIDFLDEYFPD
jgi:hypothetical protein